MSTPIVDRPVLAGLEPRLDLFPTLQSLRTRAAALAAELGLPDQKHEEFKYTPLKRLGETAWQIATPASVKLSDFETAIPGSFEQIRVVFVNGVFTPELSTAATAEGLEFLPLEEAIASGRTEGFLGELARPETVTFEVAAHLGQLEKPAIHVLPALNTASFTSGVFLRLAKNAKVETPIHVVYVSTGHEQATTPRNLIISETGSEATLIESYVSVGSGKNLTVPVTEVFVAANATLEHVRVGNENLATTHVGLTEVKQDGDSTYRSYNVVFGAELTRNDIHLFLGGSNTHTRFDGVVAIDGHQHADNHTRLDHVKPHCESFEVYKHLLGDKSRAVFNGKIFVHQDAQKTDAKQTNMTLLLSPDAQIDTKPQLEIFADDVKCTHGATVGHLRKDALFYMRSRGIDPKQAQALLVYAFAAEVLELIEHDGLRLELERMLFEKLGTGRS